MNKSNITEFLETDIPIILVNENLTIEYENRAFYSLARTFSFSVFNFLETSDITKIQEWLSSRKPDDIYEAILDFTNVHKEKIKIFLTISQYSDKPFYKFEILPIKELANLFKEKREETKLLRNYLYLEKTFTFVYHTSSNKFALSWIEPLRNVDIYEGDFDVWKEQVLKEDFTDTYDKERFIEFCADIKRGTPEFEYNFSTALPLKIQEEKCSLVSAIRAYLENGEQIMCGTWTITSSAEVQDTSNYNYFIKDQMTGLLSKKETIENINRNISQNKSFYLIVLDIDDFKKFNDNYGHLFGDEVIKSVAKILQNVIANRGFVGRLGGDEFFAVVENIEDEEELRSILRGIRSNCTWIYKEKLQNHPVSCSFGCANFPKDATNYQDLFLIADKCLYIGKKKGKNRYIIYDINKHGVVEKESSVSQDVTTVNGLSSTMTMQKLGDQLANLYLYGKENIVDLLNNLVEHFLIDRIAIYDLPSMQANVVSTVKETKFDKNAFSQVASRYLDFFDEDNLFIMHDNRKYEFTDSELFTVFGDSSIFCCVQYILKDNQQKPQGIVSFDLCSSRQYWAKETIDMFVLFSKVIQTVLYK
ncbi:MAG: GGDEF domain-containing protein [Spirochaetaceae bacterium]|nr:GGDEF domain-containing protein [Spirochaetaceae bacterium]